MQSLKIASLTKPQRRKMRGFIQIPLLVLLLAGTVGSIYLVQQKTHFLPQAFSGKNILSVFQNQPIATSSANRPLDYQLPSSTSTIQNSDDSFLSAFQRVLQRTVNQAPASIPVKINTLPTPAISSTPLPKSYPVSYPTPTPTPSPTTAPKPKPVCSVSVLPSGTGIAPYQASVCVGNNSNPYQYIAQEIVDYDGNGSWDYQGSTYGCHSFTFQSPGTYSPKAQIINTSGVESDICQTSAIISAPTPTPSPTPMPTNDPNILMVSSVSIMTAAPGDRVTIYGSNFLNSGTSDLTTLQVWLIHSDGGVNTLASVIPNIGSTTWEQNAVSFTIGSNAVPQSGQLKVLAGNKYANISGIFTITSR